MIAIQFSVYNFSLYCNCLDKHNIRYKFIAPDVMDGMTVIRVFGTRDELQALLDRTSIKTPIDRLIIHRHKRGKTHGNLR